MNHDDPILQELGVLLAALVEDALSADQRDRLVELLREHPDAKPFYKRYLELHAMLEWEAGAVTTEEVSEGTLQDLLAMERAAEVMVVEPSKPVHIKAAEENTPWQIGGATRYLVEQPVVWGSIAAVLAIATVLAVAFSGGNKTPSPIADDSSQPGGVDLSQDSVVATLTAEHDAVWASQPGGDLRPGAPLSAGQRLVLTQGFAEITTQDGAIAVLEAPCTVALINNENAIYLDSGKLVGLCHNESSKGFVVKTDYADITDLGTEFGVQASYSSVTATVFIGEIQLTYPGSEPQLIRTNQTAILSLEGGARELQIEDKITEEYQRRLPRTALVRSATISDPRFKVEVATQGVFEDARLYSDRDHQLNGLDARGIPSELLGGDIVRMPADAREKRTPNIGDIHVQVELTQRCDIYVIRSEGAEPLDWLERDYKLTTMRLGNDATRQLTRLPSPPNLGVGPGKSIDSTFEVWQLKQPASGSVTFGSSNDNSMYCIIVQPANQDRRN